MVEHSVSTNVRQTHNAINQLNNVKYWSVGNRNKSIRAI